MHSYYNISNCNIEVKNYLKYILLALSMLIAGQDVLAQKLITYEAGMGSRDKENPDVWILYKKVHARHEGMDLYADSALLNTVKNDFTAFGEIRIDISDTTAIWGNRLYYNGETRIVEIWDDTVVMVDGDMSLFSNHLVYNRNTSTATYDEWGIANSDNEIMKSDKGHYNNKTNIFHIYGNVVLDNHSSQLYTDTLVYNDDTKIADFFSPTRIYHDTTIIYSSLGSYSTSNKRSESLKDSRIESGSKTLDCDTLRYYEEIELGKAYGHVVIRDTANHLTCFGGYGETRQTTNISMVTDSALVIYVDEGDSVWMHADTITAATTDSNTLNWIEACHHVKVFRASMQAMCDSSFYNALDSIETLYGNPVIWYSSYQSVSDTIVIHHDTAGIQRAELIGNSLCIEELDTAKYNQLKGKKTLVFFKDNEPTYADILGNAQMVYYVTDEDNQGNKSLIGVNCGVGSDMRIYFDKRKPTRVVTMGKPDMYTYPLDKLPIDQKKLKGFMWHSDRRPQRWQDVFKW